MDTAAVSASNGGNGAPFQPVSAETRDGAFPAAFGLAVITGLADEVQVTSTDAGLSVRMSWPADPVGPVAGRSKLTAARARRTAWPARVF